MRTIKRAIDTAVKSVSPRTWIALQIARRNRYFEPEFWLIPHLCSRDKAAIDVGGNFGLYTYFMSRHAREVHVFEPNPRCVAQVRKVASSNVTIHEVALSNVVGEAEMRFDPNNSGVGTIDANNRLSDNLGIKAIETRIVEVKPLDDFSLPPVSFVKIDVEGHEAAVLAGADLLIRRDRPLFLIESEIRHNPSAFSELRRILDAQGYDCLYLHKKNLVKLSHDDIGSLQAGLPETNPEYVNNFLWIPRDKMAVVDRARAFLNSSS